MKSKIEWTDKTWNPVTGCTKYSEGCRNCYAAVMAQRLKAMGLEKYKNEFEDASTIKAVLSTNSPIKTIGSTILITIFRFLFFLHLLIIFFKSGVQAINDVINSIK